MTETKASWGDTLLAAVDTGNPPPLLREMLLDGKAHKTGLRWLALWHLARGELDKGGDAAARLKRLAGETPISQALAMATRLGASLPADRLAAASRAALSGRSQDSIETLLLIELLLACGQSKRARSLLQVLWRDGEEDAATI